MKKTILSMLIVMALCLFAGRAGVAYAGSMEPDTDQEMQQETLTPSDQGAEPGIGADQGTGSIQDETTPSDSE